MVWPRFVDRAAELEALARVAHRGTYLPLYLYGPEGCGKTRLLRELLSRLEGIVAVYVDALEGERPERAVVVKAAGIGADVVAELVSSLPLGRALATRLRGVVERIASRLALRGRRLVVLVDDVTGAVGLDGVEWYVKYLQALVEDLRAEYGLESVAVIATTSEGASLDRVLRHGYARVRLLWNLSRGAAAELALELGAEEGVVDEAVRVTGGNPRALIDLASSHGWSIGGWVREVRVTRIEPVVDEVRARGLVREVGLLVEDPDAVRDEADPRVLEAYRLLVDRNLMVYKGALLLDNSMLGVDDELGIGRYYAWQLPVYRWILREILGGRV